MNEPQIVWNKKNHIDKWLHNSRQFVTIYLNSKFKIIEPNACRKLQI